MEINSKIVFNDDNIFMISNEFSFYNHFKECNIHLAILGKGLSFNTIDIQLGELGYIYTIECISLEEIHHGHSSYGMIDNTNLQKRSSPVYYGENDDFQLYLAETEMDIVLKENRQLYEYFSADRVEYYYDDDDALVLIRIKDLTPEEAAFMETTCDWKQRALNLGILGRNSSTKKIENKGQNGTESTSNGANIPMQHFKKNDEIKFGRWNQRDENNSIIWKILEAKENRILVISKQVLDYRCFHNKLEDITWESSDLRTWLNNEFLNTAFHSNERDRILTTKVTASANPESDVNPGNSTEDRIFVLSVDEADTFFSTDDERTCFPTHHAMLQSGASPEIFEKYFGCCEWWLRTVGQDQNCASFVNPYGMINYEYPNCSGYADLKVDDSCGVRPAMWLDIRKTDGIEVVEKIQKRCIRSSGVKADTVSSSSNQTSTASQQTPSDKAFLVRNLFLMIGSIILGVLFMYLFTQLHLLLFSDLSFILMAYLIIFSVKNMIHGISSMMREKKIQNRK